MSADTEPKSCPACEMPVYDRAYVQQLQAKAFGWEETARLYATNVEHAVAKAEKYRGLAGALAAALNALLNAPAVRVAEATLAAWENEVTQTANMPIDGGDRG